MRMNRFLLYVIISMLIGSCGNKVSKEKSDTWQVLFNGENLDGWVAKIHHHNLGDNFANTFSVKEGSILVSYSDYGEFNEQYGHLFYKEPFSSYHLKFKYRFTDEWLKDAPGYTFRNSGVMFHSQDPKTILKEQDWPISVEYQMLAEAEPGKSRPTGNMCSPGTDVIFEGNEVDVRHCINSTSATIPWDKWVQADLIVYRDSLVIHKVNGEEVLRYSKPTIGGGVANGYDSELKINGKALTKGYIGLQSEGQGVEFREIKIKKL